MMIRAASIFALSLLAAGLVQASQVYRWVDSAGRVHYTDQPPPSAVKDLRTLSGKGNVVEVSKESFDAKMAREKSPVVLYAGNCGPVCDQARDLLKKRGIAFTHKDPNTEPEYAVEVKKLTGTLEIPVIVVGSTHLKGLDPAAWERMLDTAGYPKTPLIPPKP
jgi:glutaredoxin